jgi:hypothetical protein
MFVSMSFFDRNLSANHQDETQKICQELKLIPSAAFWIFDGTANLKERRRPE